MRYKKKTYHQNINCPKQQSFLPWLFVVVLLCLFNSACEESFDPPRIAGNRPDIVVEAHLEAYINKPDNFGVQPRPAYVILTQSIPFGTPFDADSFEDLFVHDALITLTTPKSVIALKEICLNDLSELERNLLIELVGLNSADFSQIGIDFRTTNFCFYVDEAARTFEVGETYELLIQKDDIELRATTTTPEMYPITDIAFRVPPGDSVFFSNSRLRQMTIQANPPDSIPTYFRYFTQRNDEPLYKGNAALSGFRSVLEGKILGDGETSVALLRGQPRDSTFNTGGNAFGNYRINDRYLVKWCTIDEAHYNYWNSTEFNALNQGFFSSYTQPQFNIEGEGGIGIFGAYTVQFYEGRVPRE